MAGIHEQSSKGFSEGNRDNKSRLPDVALLRVGARENFPVARVSRLGLTPTLYDGVLQRVKDLVGRPLREAPALILLDPGNTTRFGELISEGNSYPIPAEGSREIEYDHVDADQLFIAPPECATREQVAKATALAYVFADNPLAIEHPEALWEPVQSGEYKRTVQFSRDEITITLCQEAFVKGFTTVIAAMTMLTPDEAATKLVDNASGTPGEDADYDVRKRHLHSQLGKLQKARELLVEAETGLTEDGETNVQAAYSEAHRLKEEGAETLGVFYVAGAFQIFATLTSHIQGGNKKERLREKWIKLMMENPPEQLEDLLNPVLFFQKQFRLHPNLEEAFEDDQPPDLQRQQRVHEVPNDQDITVPDTSQAVVFVDDQSHQQRVYPRPDDPGIMAAVAPKADPEITVLVASKAVEVPRRRRFEPYPFSNRDFPIYIAEWHTLHDPELGIPDSLLMYLFILILQMKVILEVPVLQHSLRLM